jgi:ABC-type Fe3+/spermidine/putrescine transport system ATPase subunit
MTAITIRLQGCRKAFADGTVAVHDLNLTVEGGESWRFSARRAAAKPPPCA